MKPNGTATPDSASESSGFSYVVVLLFVTLITVLGLSFLSKAGIGTSATLNRSSAIQAEYLAEAAANHAMWKLLNDPTFPASENRYYMQSLGLGRYGYMVRRHTDSTFATVAAIGAVGESVVKRSYVLNSRNSGSGAAQMITGTYVGDKTDDRSVTGVGFRPDVLIIKGDLKKRAMIRTSSMVGDKTKDMTGGSSVETNRIQSLDSDGFTIGDHDEVNKNGTSYYWVAFRVVEGQMEVGTYTGDGSSDRVVAGMCLSPSLVMVFTEGKKEAVHRSDYSADTFDFDDNNPESSNCILSPFLADGFRVGDNDRVNKNGFTYHYICWPNISGQQKFGGYSGDGTDNRDIIGLGFTPEFVIVRCVSHSERMVHRTASLGATGNSMYFDDKQNEGNRIQALLADGFQVGSDNNVNDFENYAYFAWARK
jgi:hypothetical protein